MPRRLLRLLVLSALLACTLELIAQRGAPGQQGQQGQQQRDAIPPGSRVEYKTFQSKLLARELRYAIYLPKSYAASNTRYPIVYFLHGLQENEMRWSTRGRADLMLDSMVSEGRIGEFIVAIPFGATSFYTNTRDGSEPWEDMVIKEFIPLIETSYRVNNTRQNRGISGISMGGYGALKIALKNPDMFGAVSAHSPALIEDFSTTNVAGRRLQMFEALFDRIYGMKQDLAYWDQNNPLTLIRNTGRLNGLKIYVDCGTEDEYGFYLGAKTLDDILTKASYAHEVHLYPGNHGWDYAARHVPESLQFHWRAFRGL